MPTTVSDAEVFHMLEERELRVGFLRALPLAQLHVLRSADCVWKYFLSGFDNHVHFVVGSRRRVMCEHELLHFRFSGDERACLPCTVAPAAMGRIFLGSVLCVAD